MTIAPELAGFLEDITVADLEADPYPVYARLRAEAPVAYIPAVDLWFVTRWRDVDFVGRNPQIFGAELADSPLDASFGSPTILTTDGEAHADLRRGLDSKYRPRKVATYLEDLVTPIVTERLDALAGRPSAELLADYFEPISVTSLGRVLGLGHLPSDTLRRWFHGLHQGAINFERDPARQRISDAVAAEIDEELAPVFARLAVQPNDSTISHLLHSGLAAGQRRDVSAILPSLKVIVLGGMQEPGHGAATATYAVLADPDLRAAVRADPDLVLAAVEEGLRWVSPIGTQTREVREEVELGGVRLPVGARVGSVIASANRDESVYEQPDRFRLDRERKAHAGFGFGIHFCVGHAFAKGQMQIAVRALLERFPDLRLDDSEPVTFRGWEFRAPGSLRVHLA